jgi:hypothetical protein
MYLGAPYAFNKTKFTDQKYFPRVFGVMCFFFLYFRGSFVYSMCTKVAPFCALIEYTLLIYIKSNSYAFPGQLTYNSSSYQIAFMVL